MPSSLSGRGRRPSALRAYPLAQIALDCSCLGWLCPLGWAALKARPWPLMLSPAYHIQLMNEGLRRREENTGQQEGLA